MKKGRVTVVIPNYNYERFLSEAIDSVRSQTYRDLEIVVVDDGSTDRSREVIAAYGDEITAIFQNNRGVSTARNNGAQAGTGEYIAFIDADDVWLPAKIERQVARLVGGGALGLVHVAIVLVDENGASIREVRDGQEGTVAQELLRFERGAILGGGSGLIVRRSVFEEVGGFDSRLSTSADWDLFYRISSRYQVGFVPEVLLKYRIHGSNMHSNVRLMEHDMLLGFEKAFANGATADRRLCYGNLYKTLAGSYFRAGHYGDFARHTFKSIWNRPSNLGYFIGFPLRKINKK
jgi:glycosyltransferase involved in cell wall biosynthesis